MPDSKISALTAVVTPADTDEFAVNQADTSKKISRAQVFTDPKFGSYFDLAAIANPAVPAADTLRIFGRKTAGRMLPKWMGPSGLDTPFQPAMFGNRIIMYLPSLTTVGTGVGTSLGPAWVSTGTVSHPAPSTTAPAKSNQMARTRWANVATTQNQTLGARSQVLQFWRGNAAGLGGFFFTARFIIELWPAATCRVFVGLAPNVGLISTDTVQQNMVGLWHDTTDPNSGANSFNLATRGTGSATKTSIALTNAIAAGNSYDFYMFCAPNGTEVFYRLDDILNGVSYEGSTSLTLPANTELLQAFAQMSNGTANTTVTTVAIGVAGIYVESDY